MSAPPLLRINYGGFAIGKGLLDRFATSEVLDGHDNAQIDYGKDGQSNQDVQSVDVHNA
jgi:hypothetical protein